MNSFQYVSATSPAGARELLSEGGRYLAGGVDLLGQIKESISEPKLLVNIKALPGLNTIDRGAQAWVIGANVTVAQLEDDAELRKIFPGLQEAASEVGSRQIRNVATVGGNLAQHSRCWYYRQRDVHCLKKGGDTCFARNGENRYHSLFTGNTCISPVVSNLAIALAALDARVHVQRGDKAVPLTVAELYAKAWDNPVAHHSLERDDLVLKVEIPVQRKRSAYAQVSERAAFDWALVSCAAAANLENGKLVQPRVALGAVSNIPHQVAAANQFLEGKELNDANLDQAANLVLAAAKPLAGNGYKVAIARALIIRTLRQLAA